jgi:hypothetical protein
MPRVDVVLFHNGGTIPLSAHAGAFRWARAGRPVGYS